MQVERLPFDMETEVQQFYTWLADNKLTVGEISLWHALVLISTEAKYPIWLSVAVSRLEKFTGMKKDALYKAREGLEQKGIIQIQGGKGSQAAKYRLILFTEESEADEPETKPAPSGFEEKPIEEAPQPSAIPGEQPVKIFRKIQTIIQMISSTDISVIKDYLEEGMEDELLIESINIAEKELFDKKPADKWRYAKGIMRNWYNNGIKTIEAYNKHERERKEILEDGATRKPDRPTGAETEPEQRQNGMREFRIPE